MHRQIPGIGTVQPSCRKKPPKDQQVRGRNVWAHNTLSSLVSLKGLHNFSIYLQALQVQINIFGLLSHFGADFLEAWPMGS